MNARILLIALLTLLKFSTLTAQFDTRAWEFSGIVYDELFNPIPYTHVLATGTRQGDVTDSLGIFTLYVRETDVLSFYNLTCRDTSVVIDASDPGFYIKLSRKIYSLNEAKIFNWGNTYDDFINEVERLGVTPTEGVRLGLPIQSPGVLPFDMDEKKLKSPGFLLSSPVSFFYYNFSKREKSARKANKLDRDSELISRFKEILSAENISGITGYQDQELVDFMLYLNSKIDCTYSCTEIEILTEVHEIWNEYKRRKEIRVE